MSDKIWLQNTETEGWFQIDKEDYQNFKNSGEKTWRSYREISQDNAPNEFKSVLSDCKTVAEMAEAFKNKYERDIIEVGTFKTINPEHVKEALQGVERVLNDFPDILEFQNFKINAKTIHKDLSAAAGFYFDGNSDDGYSAKSWITFQKKYLKANAEEYMSNTKFKGFNDKSIPYTISGEHKNNKEITGFHEMGHVVSYYLSTKKYKEEYGADFLNDKSSTANANDLLSKISQRGTDKMIVDNAMKIVDKNKASALLISKYANENVSETVAEAVADCYTNGDNAEPLSKAILKELKKEYNKYK